MTDREHIETLKAAMRRVLLARRRKMQAGDELAIALQELDRAVDAAMTPQAESQAA